MGLNGFYSYTFLPKCRHYVASLDAHAKNVGSQISTIELACIDCIFDDLRFAFSKHN
jgi:hypothetical protein